MKRIIALCAAFGVLVLMSVSASATDQLCRLAIYIKDSQFAQQQMATAAQAQQKVREAQARSGKPTPPITAAANTIS